ncbi:hypothetical protein VOLCADRAFT_93661 [Volvox carteri f. nagariensis]|uniref:Transcriptional regulator n=1 Tax=Volvox carteri f. nagariensis TaxID=3068 RepID=D8U2P8_VOLCA|nr:uncharacterized protein VOLCADRAFT_93661 [Volvox carteri f. nagariensis]EFJ45844.1 hypothetical protein VOLCADRAFT_93661 [Volvox carteri f. nagariensis]|eukprot:XP_002952922.1 hypothetical protein VOLCADRAFT_93661 [Volvox carteri f. nagariensis]
MNLQELRGFFFRLSVESSCKGSTGSGDNTTKTVAGEYGRATSYSIKIDDYPATNNYPFNVAPCPRDCGCEANIDSSNSTSDFPAGGRVHISGSRRVVEALASRWAEILDLDSKAEFHPAAVLHDIVSWAIEEVAALHAYEREISTLSLNDMFVSFVSPDPPEGDGDVGNLLGDPMDVDVDVGVAFDVDLDGVEASSPTNSIGAGSATRTVASPRIDSPQWPGRGGGTQLAPPSLTPPSQPRRMPSTAQTQGPPSSSPSPPLRRSREQSRPPPWSWSVLPSEAASLAPRPKRSPRPLTSHLESMRRPSTLLHVPPQREPPPRPQTQLTPQTRLVQQHAEPPLRQLTKQPKPLPQPHKLPQKQQISQHRVPCSEMRPQRPSQLDQGVRTRASTSTESRPSFMRPTASSCAKSRNVTAVAADLAGHEEGFKACGLPQGFPTPDITGQDWRAFRAHLVAWEHSARRAAERSSQLQRPPYPPLVSGKSWAHPLAEPEAGCLLLARQDNMSWYTGSVILIASHDPRVGSVGYVLNKPANLTLGELKLLESVPGFQEAFGSQRMQLGGPLYLDRVALLHRLVGLRGSQKIAEGMYMGGLPDAIRLVTAGVLRPQDFTLVLGMCGWRPGQLVDEVAAGWWHLISASPDLVLPSPASPRSANTATEDCSNEGTIATNTTNTSSMGWPEGPRSSTSSPSSASPPSSASLKSRAAAGCSSSAASPSSALSCSRGRLQEHREEPPPPQQQQQQEGEEEEDEEEGALEVQRRRCMEAAEGGQTPSSSNSSSNSRNAGGRSSSSSSKGSRRRSGSAESAMYKRIARLAVRGA